MTANHTKCNPKQPEVSTFCNLTEQWKKGELPSGYYYVKNEFGDIFPSDYSEEYDHIGDTVIKDFFTEIYEITEIIAPVPSYDEWRQLIKFLEEFNSLDVAKENKKLKELLLQIYNRQSLIREYLSDCKLGNAWDLLYQTENEIDNAIGEKK